MMLFGAILHYRTFCCEILNCRFHALRRCFSTRFPCLFSITAASERLCGGSGGRPLLPISPEVGRICKKAGQKALPKTRKYSKIPQKVRKRVGTPKTEHRTPAVSSRRNGRIHRHYYGVLQKHLRNTKKKAEHICTLPSNAKTPQKYRGDRIN